MNNIPYLLSDIDILPNINHKIKQLVEKVCGTRVIDVLLHKPIKIIDRSLTTDIKKLKNKDIITVIIKSVEHISPPSIYKGRRYPYKIRCITDGNVELFIHFFNSNSSYLKKILPIGIKKVVSGKLYSNVNKLYISHPDKILPLSSLLTNDLKHEAIYSLTAGLSNNKLSEIINIGLNCIPSIQEWIPDTILCFYKWLSFKETIKKFA